MPEPRQPRPAIRQVEDRRSALCDWLTANGVDPNRVPQWSDLYVTTDDGAPTLHFELYDVGDNGRLIRDERGDRAAVRDATVPLTVQPPDWWQPHRKPTRERLLEAVATVSALHVRNANTGVCEHCSERDYPDYEVSWPCPTMQAIGDLQPGATTQAADGDA